MDPRGAITAAAVRDNADAPAASTEAVPAQPYLGQQLRRLRTDLGMTVAEVSQVTGLSRSFLSLLEAGKSDIAIGRLLRLTALYNADISQVLPQASPNAELIRAGEHRLLSSTNERFTLEFLTSAARPIRPLLLNIDPQGGLDHHVRDAGDAFLYVLKGILTVNLGEDHGEIELLSGDSVYIPSQIPRRFFNSSSERVSFINVVVRDDQMNSVENIVGVAAQSAELTRVRRPKR